MITPLNQGALGDDTPYIQAELNKNAYAVELGPGKFYLRTPLLCDGNPILRGQGSATQLIATTKAIQVNSGRGIATERVVLENLLIDGQNNGYTGIELGQIDTSPDTGIVNLKNVVVTRFGIGVHLKIAALPRFENLEVSACATTGCQIGTLGTDYDNGVLATLFDRCRFINNHGRGLHILNGDQITFFHCQFEDNGGDGVMVTHPGGANRVMRNLLFERCYWEDNNGTVAGYNLNTECLSTQIIRFLRIRGARFQGSDLGHVFFSKGFFLEEYNDYNTNLANAIVCQNSTVCWPYGISELAPTDYYATPGAAVSAFHRQEGGGSFVTRQASGGAWSTIFP